jgi:hypothetical protein
MRQRRIVRGNQQQSEEVGIWAGGTTCAVLGSTGLNNVPWYLSTTAINNESRHYKATSDARDEH